MRCVVDLKSHWHRLDRDPSFNLVVLPASGIFPLRRLAITLAMTPLKVASGVQASRIGSWLADWWE